jgi:C1A family cysteine protease
MSIQHSYLSGISRLATEKLSLKILDNVLHYTKLPMSVDLRPKMPFVYDQGNLGSCTANALVANFQYDDPDFYGSRLFLYFNERFIENDVGEDGGAQLSDGIQSLQQFGLCLETSWPYNISKFTEKPSDSCYSEALNHKALIVENIHQDANTMRNALAQGIPFVVGIQIFEEFESEQVAKTGIVPMPTQYSNCLGGHAVSICGYTPLYWICRNSWGPDWGDHGYFYLPHAYLLDSSLTSDLWSIKKVQE